MFGPLNGVRIGLVATAVIAAVAAAIGGHFIAALVLLVAVGVHGLGWLYLYSNRDQAEESPLKS